jgi:hypothetical protein
MEQQKSEELLQRIKAVRALIEAAAEEKRQRERYKRQYKEVLADCEPYWHLDREGINEIGSSVDFDLAFSWDYISPCFDGGDLNHSYGIKRNR